MIGAAAMNTTTTSGRRDFLTLVGLAFALLLGGIYATRLYLMDDALITLRYSLNLARHGHAIWNQADAADPSLGYTTVLWMLINAIPAFFTQNKDLLVLCCKLIGLIPLAVIVFLLVGPISRMPIPRLFRAAVVVLIFSQVVYGFHLNSGMETLLFSALVLLTVCSYAQTIPYSLAYVFGTLAFLTRPEGAIVVALMLLWDVRQGRIKAAVVGGACFSITALALALSLLAAYGTVLPNAFYVKQGGFSVHSFKATISFLLSVALPYLPLAAYSVYSLKHSTSRYCWNVAGVYLAYYLTVLPIMDVYSRYQWPVLVLLTYASLPGFQKLGEAITGYGSTAARRLGQDITRHQAAGPRRLALGLLVLFALVNLKNGLGASHMARRAGVEERNLIALGKVMASHRSDRRWMAYCDAGAVCYYSDWNTYDTVGLNTRKIATKSITPMQAYGYPSTDLVLLNCGDDPEWKGVMSWQESNELGDRLGTLGYYYAGSVPIRTQGARRPWVVAVYGRSLPRAKALMRSVQVAPEVPPSPLERARALLKRVAKGQLHPPAAPSRPEPTLSRDSKLPIDKQL
jgi:hypothetical protein